MEKAMERALAVLEEKAPVMMAQWNLPGLSAAVVRKGEVVAVKSWGSRDVAGGLAMTNETVLPVGSITKSFTALILGMLVDEGKLEWDKPVKAYIPWLQLADAEATEKVTARDLLCHRVGMPKYDVHGVFCTKDDREQMVRDLAHLPFNQPFRSTLQYSNQMVMVAGYLAEVICGKSWEELVRERIFEPLGMTDTNTTIAELENCAVKSKGYLFNGTENMETPYLSLKGIGPAGAINSTAVDMARYLQFQLGDGSWEGKQLISKATLDEMHTTQMMGTPYYWQLEEISEANYGLGWFTDVYRGEKMVSHGGNTLGFSSLMTMLPEKDFGIVLLTNANSCFMTNPLTYSVLDALLGVEVPDWTAKMQAKIGEVFGAMGAAMEAKAKAQVQGTTPSVPVEELAGKYSHPAFGVLELAAAGGQLAGNMNGYQAMAMHYHYDQFDIMLPLMGVVFPGEFIVEDGKVTGIRATADPTVPAFIFAKEA